MATTTSASSQSTVTSWSDGRSPDLAIVIQGDPGALVIDVQTISDALRDSSDASNFAVVPTSADTTVIYINSAGDADAVLLSTVEGIVETNSANTSVSVLGTGAADVRLRQSIGREALLAIGVVALVTGAILALLYGWQVGVGVACVLSASAILASIIGSLFNPRFNGSILSTSLPAIVASLLVAVMMGYHITCTASVSATSDDLRSTLSASADVMRQLAIPIVIVLGQLACIWLVVELLFPSSNPVLSTFVGAVAGTLVGLLLVPLLVQVGGVSFDRPSQRLRYILSEHEMAQTIGVGVVALVVVITVVGVLNSFGRPSAGSLDQRALDTHASSGTALNNGDLTEAIVVKASPKLAPETIDRFAAEVSAWPAVKLAQTSTVVAIDGSTTNNVEIGRERPFAGLETANSQLVLVVPNSAERSDSTQQLVMDLKQQDLLSNVSVEDGRIDDVELESRGGWLLISVVLISCLGGIVAALASGGDSSVVLGFLVVRLFLLLGTIGIGSSLIAAGSVDEIVLLVLAIVLVLAWFEVSYWRYQEPGFAGHRSLSNYRNVSSAQRIRTPMRSSSAGLVSLAAVGVAWMFADAPYIRPMGMALVVVPIVITAAINVLLPSLFGQGSVFGVGQYFPNRGSKLSSIGPTMLSIATQPFGLRRSWLSMPSNLGPLAVPKSFGTKPSDIDEHTEVGGSEPDIDEGTSDEDFIDSGVDAEMPTGDIDGPVETVDHKGGSATNSLSGASEGSSSIRDKRLQEEPSDQTVVTIDGFSDLTIAGEGGFAVVYRAVDSSGSVVAIKVLIATSGNNERRRFAREKDALEALADVDGVVGLLGAGQTNSGAPYLVLTYLDGGTVARRIRNRPYNWHEAYELGSKLAEILSVCHRKGVFHRDLKPSNVLLDKDANPYLLDFGSTQIVDGRSLSTRSTFTPNYCPPEVLVVGNKGSDSGLVDVYGLGILLWSIVAGRRPFVSEGSESDEVPTVFNRVATQELEPLVGVPGWFREIVERAIEKSPSKRFGSMAEMHTALVTRSVLQDIGGDHQGSEGRRQGSQILQSPRIDFGDLFARRSPVSEIANAPKTRPNKLLKIPTAIQTKRVQKVHPVRKKPLDKKPLTVDWSAEASRLIMADFELASSLDSHLVDEVYFPGTDVYEIAQKMRSHYLELGHEIVGDKPMVLKVDVVGKDAPIRLEVVVAHPPYVLLDSDGNQLQSCPFERRRSALWLVETDQGYRISAIVLRTSEQDES